MSLVKTKEVKEEKESLDLSVAQLEGVGPVTAKKLNEFGVTSLIDICVRGAKELSEITGVAKIKTNVWVTESKKILEDNNMIRQPDMDTIELMEYQEKLLCIKHEGKLIIECKKASRRAANLGGFFLRF